MINELPLQSPRRPFLWNFLCDRLNKHNGFHSSTKWNFFRKFLVLFWFFTPPTSTALLLKAMCSGRATKIFCFEKSQIIFHLSCSKPIWIMAALRGLVCLASNGLKASFSQKVSARLLSSSVPLMADRYIPGKSRISPSQLRGKLVDESVSHVSYYKGWIYYIKDVLKLLGQYISKYWNVGRCTRGRNFTIQTLSGWKYGRHDLQWNKVFKVALRYHHVDLEQHQIPSPQRQRWTNILHNSQRTWIS